MPESAAQGCTDAAARFAQIEAAIDGGRATAAMRVLFDETRHSCETLARHRGPAAPVAKNLVTAVAAWRDVWPRLGREADFRLAVAREAKRWAVELEALAKAAGPG